MLFVDKYRPKTSKGIVGSDYAIRELVKWLKAWRVKGKDTQKAFMLSGPPGIGKSALVDLVVAECNIPNAIKFDSLKKRTKKALKKVEEAFGTRKIDAYFTGKMQRAKPGAVIMDDMDSMLTSADQGGIPQIVAFLKTTQVPIICICNEPNSKSIRSLRDKCQHVRMQRPTTEAIMGHLAAICHGEKRVMSTGQLRVLAMSSGGDVRHAVNELQFALSGNGSPGASIVDGTGITMDRMLNPFDAAAALFRQVAPAHALCKREAIPLIQTASRAVDSDQQLVPLMIHENYLRTGQSDLVKMADAADDISLGDFMEGCYRKCGTGMLLDIRPVLAVAKPCFTIGLRLGTRSEFPAFLSHVGEINRRKKTMAEVANRMTRSGTQCSAKVLAIEKMGFLQDILINPMTLAGPPALPAATTALANGMAVKLRGMHITRTDWDYIAETADFPTIRAAKKKKLVTPAGRAALTRAMQPKVRGAAVGKKGAKGKGVVGTTGKQPPRKKSKYAVEEVSDEEKSDKEAEDPMEEDDTEMMQ